MRGRFLAIVVLIHSRNTVSTEGRGVSSLSGSAGVELDGGILEIEAAELLYPSSESPKEEARYHCMTCSGLGTALGSLKPVNSVKELVVSAALQLDTSALRVMVTDD